MLFAINICLPKLACYNVWGYKNFLGATYPDLPLAFSNDVFCFWLY